MTDAFRTAVAAIAAADADFARIEREHGPAVPRVWAPGLPTLLRIVMAQQISTAAAAAIYARLEAAVPLEAAALAAAPEADLKAAGLSRPKIRAVKAITASIETGKLSLDALQHMDDASAAASLTAVPGIGPWTATVYMLFVMQRLDVLPAGDIALQSGYGLLKGLEARPDAKALARHLKPLAPHRGAAAHLLWHFYRARKGAPPPLAT